MQKLRVGVIGLGMGRGHAKEFKSHPQVDLVAVSDTDAERLKTIGDELGVHGRYTDPLAMLRDERLDVVSVATPNKFHKPLTIAALEAGAHVLCEKPMAMSAAEAREMLAVSRRVGRRLMINFSYRFTPQSWALKHEVDAGLLGDVYYGRTYWLRRRGMPRFGGWFGQKELAGGGPLIDLGVHRLDLALWLMGYPRPEWVVAGAWDFIAHERAKREGKAYDVEDMAAAMIRFTNGAMLSVEASWAGNIKENELMETRLLGTKGGLVQRNTDGGYSFDAEMFYEKNGTQYDLKAQWSSIPGVKSSMRHFVDCILSGEPHTATGEEGVTVMELLDAIYESARRREPIRITPHN